MKDLLIFLQIASAIIIIILILLQQRGGGLGSVFGGESVVFQTRRGIEKTIFYLTIFFFVFIIIISILRIKFL